MRSTVAKFVPCMRFGIQAMYYKVHFTLCSFETKMSLLRPNVVFTYLWYVLLLNLKHSSKCAL